MATITKCDRPNCNVIMQDRQQVTRLKIETSLLALMEGPTEYAEPLSLDLCFDCGVETRQLMQAWFIARPKQHPDEILEIGDGHASR